MNRSRSFAWGGPANPISGTLTGSEQRRAPAQKSLRSRRAFVLETLCRRAEGTTTRGTPWLNVVMGAVSAR